ncbi:MAG: signal peptidase I [Methanobacterium sp.]
MNKKEIIQVSIALLIITLLFNTLIPFITGSEKALIVLSGSMTPLMLPGDIAVIKSVDPNELAVGDILAFRDPGGKPDTLITHRIISLKKDKELTFKTKGDANNEEDDFNVPASNAVGKLVFVIPFAGYLPKISKSKNLYFLTIILPATIIIIDEIKNLTLYSNPPRARKVEKERKKKARRKFYKFNGKRLVALILIIGLIFTGIVSQNMGENGPAILERKNIVENSGFLSLVYIFTPEDSEKMFAINPWYGVVPPANETQVIAPKNMPVNISYMPYILPVFWIIELARIDPDLPATVGVVVYTLFFTLLLFPIWYQKSAIGGRRKSIRFRRLFTQWKRNLRFVNL